MSRYVLDDGCCPHGALHVCPAGRSAAPAPLDAETQLREDPLICAACGGTTPPVVEVPLHPSCASPSVALDADLIEKARDWRYSDEWIGKAIRARLSEGTDR